MLFDHADMPAEQLALQCRHMLTDYLHVSMAALTLDICLACQPLHLCCAPTSLWLCACGWQWLLALAAMYGWLLAM